MMKKIFFSTLSVLILFFVCRISDLHAETGPFISPELCDGIDNNQNGQVDEYWPDSDGDGLVNCNDNCPYNVNPNQPNSDGDIFGNACDIGFHPEWDCQVCEDDWADPDVVGCAESDTPVVGDACKPDRPIDKCYTALLTCGRDAYYECTITPKESDETNDCGFCGDGIQNTDEECDDGNSEDNDGCSSSTCQIEECGDGIRQSDPNRYEDCDDGNQDNTDDCVAGCQRAVCGDEFVEEGREHCDDGNDVDDDACSNNCAPPRCGDAILQVQEGEVCDQGFRNSDTTPDACRTSCTPATCGDNIVDSDEECDDGNDDNTDGCRNDCSTAPEICDGQDNDLDGQTDEGLLNACGECGEVPVEICDGQDNDCDGSTDEGVTNACGTCGPVPAEVCDGDDNDCDGQVDDGLDCSEICDGVDNDDDGQIDEGVKNACGTCGEVPVEICDDEIDNDCDGLIDEDCQGAPVCGNDLLEEGEECDDGNINNEDSCSSVCKTENSGSAVEVGQCIDDQGSPAPEFRNYVTAEVSPDEMLYLKAEVSAGAEIEAQLTGQKAATLESNPSLPAEVNGDSYMMTYGKPAPGEEMGTIIFTSEDGQTTITCDEVKADIVMGGGGCSFNSTLQTNDGKAIPLMLVAVAMLLTLFATRVAGQNLPD